MNYLRRALVQRAAQQAAQRRRLLLWLETVEAMTRTPARTDDEREAKIEALELLEAARPGAVKPA